MPKGILLPIFYLGPLEYFSLMKNQKDQIAFEKFEHFPKQTFRNRASIYSPNGKLDLIIPVKKGLHIHSQIKDVRISYDADWQRLHWRSLQTCYRRSSFFEYYEDEFAPFYHTKTQFLIDYNVELLSLCFKLLKIDIEIDFTTEFLKHTDNIEDCRNSISHKTLNTSSSLKPYFQVFEEKYNFIPNLSIVDLLFNQGPQSKQFL